MKGLTDRQLVVLGVISKFMDENGYAPTLRELGWLLGISSLRGVVVHIEALENKGMLRRGRCGSGAAVARAIRLLPAGMQALGARRPPACIAPIRRAAAGDPALGRDEEVHRDRDRDSGCGGCAAGGRAIGLQPPISGTATVPSKEQLELVMGFVEREMAAWEEQVLYRRQSRRNRLAAQRRLAECRDLGEVLGATRRC